MGSECSSKQVIGKHLIPQACRCHNVIGSALDGAGRVKCGAMITATNHCGVELMVRMMTTTLFAVD
jgi:hypothetical protein